MQMEVTGCRPRVVYGFPVSVRLPRFFRRESCRPDDLSRRDIRVARPRRRAGAGRKGRIGDRWKNMYNK